jgi:hypothetical protein
MRGAISIRVMARSEPKQLVEYEREVVRTVMCSHVHPETVEQLIESAEFISCEHTGVGYFLTMRHPSISEPRVVLDEPMTLGRSGKIECGFLIFLERGELMLECYSFGDETIPEDIRERRLEIRPAN